MADEGDTGRHLRLVAERRSVVDGAPAASSSLAAAPFRPGELPVLRWVTLGAEERRMVRERAAEARIPAELWLRAAVEASRLLDETALLTRRTRFALEAELDRAAAEPLARPADALAAAALQRYAESLQRGDAWAPLRSDAPLRLSEEMAGAWGRAAAAKRASLPDWIAGHLSVAPRRCVDWEAAAALDCRTMAEWVYACSLRRLASATP